MKPQSIFVSVCLAISIFLSACGASTTSTPDATATPAPTLTATLTPTITPSPTITPTPTPTIPIVTVIEQANCYGGPGDTAYDKITTLEIGEKVEVIGQDSEGKYWIVVNPHGEGGCWIQSHKAKDFTGDLDAVLVLVAPPTPILPAPAAPENISVIANSCTAIYMRRSPYYVVAPKFDHFEATITLKWDDISDNETGFRIFKNGEIVAEIEANETQYTNGFNSNVENEKLVYEIQAFNEQGDSEKTQFIVYDKCVKTNQ